MHSVVETQRVPLHNNDAHHHRSGTTEKTARTSPRSSCQARIGDGYQGLCKSTNKGVTLSAICTVVRSWLHIALGPEKSLLYLAHLTIGTSTTTREGVGNGVLSLCGVTVFQGLLVFCRTASILHLWYVLHHLFLLWGSCHPSRETLQVGTACTITRHESEPSATVSFKSLENTGFRMMAHLSSAVRYSLSALASIWSGS